MPKKRLTKAQVKKKLTIMGKTLAEMADDKLYHSGIGTGRGSFVPLSLNKIIDLQNQLVRAFKRMK